MKKFIRKPKWFEDRVVADLIILLAIFASGLAILAIAVHQFGM